MALDLSLLNPQQRQAVLATEGPVLVLAGAGSGKTRVIAHRVVHLLDRGVPARAILAVTFTNKAAAEMRERIARLAGGRERCRGLTISTFHAFGVRVLREQRARVGLPERFAIFDAGDQTSLVKRLLREVKVDDRRFDTGRVLAILSRLRTSGEARHPDDEYELIAAELKPRYELGCAPWARSISTTCCCFPSGCSRSARCSSSTSGATGTCSSTSTRTPTTRSSGCFRCSPACAATCARWATTTRASTPGGARRCGTSS